MFVRVKKIGAYEYLYLVENAREGGRHVQRVVKALGRRDEVEAPGMLDALVASAARHSRRSIVLSRFYRGELAELRRVSIGPDLVFGRLSSRWCSAWFSTATTGRSPPSCGPETPPTVFQEIPPAPANQLHRMVPKRPMVRWLASR